MKLRTLKKKEAPSSTSTRFGTRRPSALSPRLIMAIFSSCLPGVGLGKVVLPLICFRFFIFSFFSSSSSSTSPTSSFFSLAIIRAAWVVFSSIGRARNLRVSWARRRTAAWLRRIFRLFAESESCAGIIEKTSLFHILNLCSSARQPPFGPFFLLHSVEKCYCCLALWMGSVASPSSLCACLHTVEGHNRTNQRKSPIVEGLQICLIAHFTLFMWFGSAISGAWRNLWLLCWIENDKNDTW